MLSQRIGAVIKRRQKQRLADAAKLAQKEARGDYSHLKNKKGEMIAKPLPQPTLPNLSVDDDDDTLSVNTRGPPPSAYTQDYYNHGSDNNSAVNGDYPPSMPAYSPYSPHQPPGSHTQFHKSSTSFPHDDQNYYHQHQMYDEDNESTAHLTMAAAPFSQQPANQQPGYPSAAYPYGHMGHNGGGHSYEPHDVYQGRVGTAQAPSQRPSSTGLAYDDAPEYSRYGPPPPTHSDNPYNHSGYPQRGYDARGDDGYFRAM
jgi:hypothetical protein